MEGTFNTEGPVASRIVSSAILLDAIQNARARATSLLHDIKGPKAAPLSLVDCAQNTSCMFLENQPLPRPVGEFQNGPTLPEVFLESNLEFW